MNVLSHHLTSKGRRGRLVTITQACRRGSGEGDRGRQFQVADQVMRGDHRHQLENKFSPKWTGPFRTEALENGAYRLETLEGGAIPRTWNTTNLKFYFS